MVEKELIIAYYHVCRKAYLFSIIFYKIICLSKMPSCFIIVLRKHLVNTFCFFCMWDYFDCVENEGHAFRSGDTKLLGTAILPLLPHQLVKLVFLLGHKLYKLWVQISIFSVYQYIRLGILSYLISSNTRKTLKGMIFMLLQMLVFSREPICLVFQIIVLPKTEREIKKGSKNTLHVEVC